MAEQNFTSKRQTTEQRRAANAWQEVEQAGKTLKQKQGDYKRLVRSIVADVLNHGLGQVLAFLRAKGYENGREKQDDHHALLYRHLTDWICGEMGWSNTDLLRKLTQGGATTAHYRRATVEAMAYLEWLKRFAEAELEGGAQ
ncbi:MAG: type III-B CRISPR module-associated protein Cmr5 [Syntrophobacteria bacterium]